MINRVRNTRSVEIDIFIKTGNGDRNYPLKIDEIKLWLQEKDDLIFTSGLKIDHTRNKLVEDDYYNQYIQYIKKQHTSKVCFKQVLRGILEAHGFEMRIDEFSDDFVTVDEVVDLKQLDEIKVEAKVAINEHQDKVRNEVCNAKIITEQQYSVISEQYKKTADEKLQIRRYCLTKAYGLERDLTSEFIKTFEDIIPQYYNLGKMNCGGNNLKFYIENELNNYLKENKSINNTERLHEKYHLLKLWTVHGIVQMLGFENIWDKKEICGYPYDKAVVFLEKYHHKISVLFGNNAKKDWSKLDINDKNDKRTIALALNTVLKNVCNIGVKNKYLGRRSKEDLYCIKGFELFENNHIEIPVNDVAERLVNDRLYIKKKVVVNNKISYEDVIRTEAELKEYDQYKNKLLYTCRLDVRTDYNDDLEFDFMFNQEIC
jgi:hypothetical protein